jgi:3-dehydroquinate synthase
MNDDFVMNWKVASTQRVEYEISYAPDLLEKTNTTLAGGPNASRRLVFIDENVDKTYGQMIRDYFNFNSPLSKIVLLKTDEEAKNLETALFIIQEMEAFGLLRRDEPVLAIGGGSLLDCVGFAASTFRRGIPYIRVPTTLLSMVDVSVAIKTGINHLGRKNRLGSYYPPQKVFLYRKFIDSQSDRALCNGLGEIFKLALIDDIGLFALLDENANLLRTERFQYGAVPVKIINRSISVMLNHLQSNLWESDLKRAVDFGHSFSPLIEHRSLPELMHGEAVALDCLFSSCLSNLRGDLSNQELEKIFQVCFKLGLPVFHRDFVDPHKLIESLQDTMRHRNGEQNLPLPIGIGFHNFANGVTHKDLQASASIFREISSLF